MVITSHVKCRKVPNRVWRGLYRYQNIMTGLLWVIWGYRCPIYMHKNHVKYPFPTQFYPFPTHFLTFLCVFTITIYIYTIITVFTSNSYPIPTHFQPNLTYFFTFLCVITTKQVLIMDINHVYTQFLANSLPILVNFTQI